jgi:hypothetical protein
MLTVLHLFSIITVRSILIKTGRGEEQPSVLRLYANRTDGFVLSPSSVQSPIPLPSSFHTYVHLAHQITLLPLNSCVPCLFFISLQFSESPPPPEGLKPSQELSLFSSTSNAVVSGVTEYPLKVQVFKDVVSMSLFLGESEGGEKTRI